MVKAYLRHVLARTDGVIASPEANTVVTRDGIHLITAACENVIIWNIKTGVQQRILPGENSEVTIMSLSHQGDHLAVGDNEGKIRVWKLGLGDSLALGDTSNLDEPALTFHGHKTAVSALAWGPGDGTLFSGGKDTDIVAWDVTAEAGMYRLRGHKNAITGLFIAKDTGVLLSSSKDTFIKVWDLETQHCIQTVVGHRHEIWAMGMNDAGTRLVTGSSDNVLRVWSLNDLQGAALHAQKGDEFEGVKLLGTVPRQSQQRVTKVQFFRPPQGGELLAAASNDKHIEMYRVRNEADARKKMLRRLKRKREKKKASGGDKGEGDGGDTVAGAPGGQGVDADDTQTVTAGDEIATLQVIRCSSKVASFDFNPLQSPDGSVQLCVTSKANMAEVYRVGASDHTRLATIDQGGHRADVRALALSNDDGMLASVSHGECKVWNTKSGQCFRTMPSGYGLGVLFVPGGQQLVVACKSGALELYDLPSGEMIERVDEAHAGAVWSMHIAPDGKSFVTGSADRSVKFWDFVLVPSADGRTQQLSISLQHTMEMSDDVMCVRYSPDGRLLAASLLDNTVKVFYADTLRFFLSLYGHKLPVLSMDISSDSTLMVTGSADKNIKIWGLDFGDCHKSMFAHDDNVMSVRFVPKTHYVFSAGKDGVIKNWDCDKFELITTLRGHHKEVWGLEIAKRGDFFVTCSHDRSIRRWERTDEPLFIEEERENELESEFDKNAGALEAELQAAGGADGQQGESGRAGQQSKDTLMAGERLSEALALVDAESQRTDDTPPSVLLLGMTPSAYLLRAVQMIRRSHLEDALAVVPFHQIVILLQHLIEWTKAGLQVELGARIALYLTQLHHNQIAGGNAKIKALTSELADTLRGRLRHIKDAYGFNLAGLKFLKNHLELNNQAVFFEAREQAAKGRRKRKRRTSDPK
eukprot:TRINITY_DN17753_c0_g1_i1.p1 TRINITY_DN17753_c0_g1~~TRINITY_DN17753_c0_g1_i1.p1  ORF type:complete len:923 (-),score=232.55 TRINITY_DN17753_c0_g1_i1:604-3372(-)